jgi:hypothetical protein
VVDVDLEKFFDRVNHDVLMSRLARRGAKNTGADRRYLEAGVMGIFGRLDAWLRHRLRAIHLKQWKRGRTVFREMRSRGASVDLAAQAAANTRRWWRTSALSLQSVLTTRYFDRLGVPRLRPVTST